MNAKIMLGCVKHGCICGYGDPSCKIMAGRGTNLLLKEKGWEKLWSVKIRK